MYFNKWLKEQLEQLPINKTELSNLSGVTYGNMNGAKKFSPRICNLILICEVLNEINRGDIIDFNKLLIEAISSCGMEYHYAIERIQERKK